MVVKNEVAPDNQSQKPPVDNRFAALDNEFDNLGVIGRGREEFYQDVTLPYTYALAQYAQAAGGPPVTVALTRPAQFVVPPVLRADPAANQQGDPSAPATEEIRHHNDMVVKNEVAPDNQSQKPPVDNRYAALVEEFNNMGVFGRGRDEFYQYVTLPCTYAHAQYARAGGPPVTVALTRPFQFVVPPVPSADPAAHQQGDSSASEVIRHHDVPQIDAAIRQIMDLGFINHRGWITQLMEHTNGDATAFIRFLDKCIEMEK